MRGRPARPAAAALALLLSACVSSKYVRLGRSTYPPRPKGFPIAVFMDASAPVAMQMGLSDTAQDTASLPPHETIGRVDVTYYPYAPVAGAAASVDEGKRRARELGGDAVVAGTLDMGKGGRMTIALRVVRYKD